MNHVKKAYMFYKKALVLLSEGEKDLEIGCYNKAVSAFYFAVEAMANVLFAIKKQKTRGFGGRLSIIRNIFGKEISTEIKKLHELREKADHREIIFNKRVAQEAADKAKELFEKIRKRALRELNMAGLNLENKD